MGAARRAVNVIKGPPVVNWKDTGGKIPVDINTYGIPPITTTQVQTGDGPSVLPISKGIQKIEGPRRSIITQEVRNTNLLDASINIIPTKYRDPTQSWSKVIGSKIFTNRSIDIYAHGQMNSGRDITLSKIPNFMNFGLSYVNKTDEIGSVFVPKTIIRRSTYRSS